ncbi:MAG TPA: hypothetical protein VJR47_09270 [Stellaceae bacterium]|nr:hypothetical protein [Stellaceae bacterium]
MYGTVSALALVLALGGVAKANDHHHAKSEAAIAGAFTGAGVVGNGAVYNAILGDNEIDDHAFTNATGAFNIGQNASINSAVQQSMAIAAVVNTDGSDTVKEGSNELALAAAGGYNFVGCNDACLTLLGGGNEIENAAFEYATGAFQILQNRSVNSAVSQSMAIGAVVNTDGRDANTFGNQTALAVSALGADVVGNHAGGTLTLPNLFDSFTNNNVITDSSFQHATGAFNVLQNASLNSSVQQGMAIGAVVNTAH